MSLLPIWGTGIAPVSSSLRRRVTSEGDLRATTDGDIRVASIAPLRVEFIRITDGGFRRITSDGFVRITRDGLQGPQYFQTSQVTSDGGEPFGFTWSSGPWQPSAQGGENVFAWAWMTFSWSMGAAIRVTPIVDDETGDLDLPDGSVLQTVRSTFQLPQQGASLQRISQEFPVPLVRRVSKNGIEKARYYMRGQRLELLVESTGQLGAGELMLDGIQVDVQPVRRAKYAPVVSNS